LDSKLTARDDHRLVIDLRINLKESLDELATQQFQATEAASELERCRTSRAELQLALDEEKQKIVRMRLANDEMLAELRLCKARSEKQADYIQKKVRCEFAASVFSSLQSHPSFRRPLGVAFSPSLQTAAKALPKPVAATTSSTAVKLAEREMTHERPKPKNRRSSEVQVLEDKVAIWPIKRHLYCGKK
jgi:hypothetical protein